MNLKQPPLRTFDIIDSLEDELLVVNSEYPIRFSSAAEWGRLQKGTISATSYDPKKEYEACVRCTRLKIKGLT